MSHLHIFPTSRLDSCSFSLLLFWDTTFSRIIPSSAPDLTCNNSRYFQVDATPRISIIAPRGEEEEDDDEEGRVDNENDGGGAAVTRIPIAARGGFALMVTVNELIPQGDLGRVDE